MKAELGSLGLQAYLWNPSLPTVIAEWAALIPLIVHLASSQSYFRMVGEAALEGRISTGLFPKLGHLDGIAKLLSGGRDFLERASPRAELDAKVWDVSWGSIFPCANGAARVILTDYALCSVTQVVKVEDWLKENRTLNNGHTLDRQELTASAASTDMGEQKRVSAVTPASKQVFRRPQTLHIIRLTRGTTKTSWRTKIDLFVESKPADALYLLALLALATLLCLFGAYGTGSIVLSRATSRIACHLLPIERPPGYLVNNELYGACMLTAVHENASTWFLYIGDRALVDWLLNKTMISIRPSNTALYRYFRFSHFFQLLAMTYVAAQKGWDGICLLFLMLMVWIVHWCFGRHRPVEDWLRKEHISFRAHSFEFTGRVPMIGAIQLLNDNMSSTRANGLVGPRNTAWMDDIVAPCMRRNTWTERLLKHAKHVETDGKDVEALNDADRKWVENNTRWAIQAADCIQTEMGEAEQIQA